MNLNNDLSKKLQKLVETENILLNEPMKNHTSFKVGGPCDILIMPEDYNTLIKAVKLCIENNVSYYIFGNGSNTIVKDKGIHGVVIKTCKLNNIEIIDNKVTAESGALLSSVSKKSANASLTGLEFASGIPGSIGGAVAMNAGAYNGEISQVIESALVLNSKGEFKELNKDELELGYRQSAILKYDYIVLKVTFKLEQGDHDKIINRIMDLSTRRREKQPLEYPSAGSTFKRPEGYYAAKLIEDSNLKGFSIGGAEVSSKHSGFIINKGNATAQDILDLIKTVQKEVKEKFDVMLEPEVRIIGE